MERWQIPIELQANALRLYYQKRTSREIYRHLWPTKAPCNLGQFEIALELLITRTQNDVKNLGYRGGVPTSRLDDEVPVAQLALSEPQELEPLSAEVELAMGDVRSVRGSLVRQIHQLEEEPVDEALAEKGKDPRASRATSLAQLAMTVAALADMELRIDKQRVDKTERMFALRLKKADAADEERQNNAVAAPNVSQGIEGPKPRPVLMLDMPSKESK